MLNDLFLFRQSLDSWGIEVPETLHSKLTPIPQGRTLLVGVGKEGVVSVNEADLSNLRDFMLVTNQRRLLVKYELDKNKFPKTVAKRVNDWRLAAQSMQNGDPRLDAFRSLAAILQTFDLQEFTQNLLKWREITEDDCLLAFEVENPFDFDNGVWSLDTIEAIDEMLKANDQSKIDASDERDIFGNPAAGWNEANCVAAKEHVTQGLRYYSRNVETEVYARFGINSAEACKIGSVTRRQIEEFLSYVFKPEHRAYHDKGKFHPGFWYTNEDRYVFSSLMPRNAVMEVGSEEGDWEQEVEKAVAAVHAQEDARPGSFGQVLIVRKPPQNRGGWVTEYSASKSYREVAEALEQWKDGIRGPRHLFYFRYPNIRSALQAFNVRFRLQSGEVKLIETKDKPKRFSLADMYEFFFGDRGVARQIAASLAQWSVRYMIESELKGSPPFEVRYLYPLCNLTLRKLGQSEEQIMKSWAFTVGRLMQLANVIHRKYFKDRHREPPDLLVGHTFIRMMYENPRTGLAAFFRRFQIYLNWAEGAGGRYCVNAYYDLLSQLTDTEIPSHPTAVDRIQMGLGYGTRDRVFENNQEAEAEAESV